MDDPPSDMPTNEEVSKREDNGCNMGRRKYRVLARPACCQRRTVNLQSGSNEWSPYICLKTVAEILQSTSWQTQPVHLCPRADRHAFECVRMRLDKLAPLSTADVRAVDNCEVLEGAVVERGEVSGGEGGVEEERLETRERKECPDGRGGRIVFRISAIDSVDG